MKQTALCRTYHSDRTMNTRQYYIRLSCALFTVFALVFAAIPASAQEVIQSFSSDITLRVDGSVEVTEYIEVNAEGIKIRRGIYRDIPVIMINDDGSKHRSKLEVLSIEKDGVAEPFFIESITNGKRIYIGDADIFLQRGTYRYKIKYSMTRMARSFDDYDELYWNATGNFWDFAIRNSVAQITLPDGAIISDLIAFTGPVGSTGQDVKITKTGNNTATFRATRSFSAYEGMSVVAKFQKGILTKPEGMDALMQYLSDRREAYLSLIAVLLVLFYYFFSWNKVGRDPEKGTIIPLYYPPENFSPALVHYIWKMGWKKGGWTAFTAALINLGVKGLVTIDKKKNSTKISMTEKPAMELPPGELIIYELIKSKEVLFINKTNGKKIGSARDAFINLLGTENRHAYFKNNFLYIIAGFVLSAACILLLVISGILPPVYAIASIGAGIGVGLFTAVIGGLMSGGGVGRFIILFWFIIAGSNMLGTIAITFSGLTSVLSILPAFAAISIIIANVVFAVLMRAPTIQGRKIMDRIAGFRMYLDTAEKERLNLAGEPPMTAKRFEKILPYAIALGVEKPWSKHFESELARNMVKDARNGYHPYWLSGTSFSPSSVGKDMAALASGMSASMISAQPASSSSSGFSGGSSGGGGGGGGGGGW